MGLPLTLAIALHNIPEGIICVTFGNYVLI